jgi:hypothetical protein
VRTALQLLRTNSSGPQLLLLWYGPFPLCCPCGLPQMQPNSASSDHGHGALTQATQAGPLGLEIVAQGDVKDEGDGEGEVAGKDGVGNLSGGERSFTTLVCGLLYSHVLTL